MKGKLIKLSKKTKELNQKYLDNANFKYQGHYLYVVYSKKNWAEIVPDRPPCWYNGSTTNLYRRKFEHNSNQKKSAVCRYRQPYEKLPPLPPLKECFDVVALDLTRTFNAYERSHNKIMFNDKPVSSNEIFSALEKEVRQRIITGKDIPGCDIQERFAGFGCNCNDESCKIEDNKKGAYNQKPEEKYIADEFLAWIEHENESIRKLFRNVPRNQHNIYSTTFEPADSLLKRREQRGKYILKYNDLCEKDFVLLYSMYQRRDITSEIFSQKIGCSPNTLQRYVKDFGNKAELDKKMDNLKIIAQPLVTAVTDYINTL